MDILDTYRQEKPTMLRLRSISLHIRCKWRRKIRQRDYYKTDL